MEEARAGDLHAFETLVRRYQTRIVNYAQAMLRDHSAAEDVAQDTFVRAYRALARFRGDSTFKTWLYRIATNAARTALDRRSRRGHLEGWVPVGDAEAADAVEVPSGLPDAEATLIARDAIDRALATLPADLRVAVILRDVEGLDYKEIAAITAAPFGTVESRIFRARQRLRPLLRSVVGTARRAHRV